MNTNRRCNRRTRAGLALLYAVFAAFIAASMVSVLFALARVSDKGAAVACHSARAQYLAEGAIEGAKKNVQTTIANWGAVPAQGEVSIDGQQVAYRITPTGFSTTVTDPAGIQTLVNGYEIEANASIEGMAARAHRIINSQATPIFQFAVFYTDDLEIQPGANMTLRGRVHSNRNIHLGSDATLTVNTNYLRAVGGIFRNRKDDPSASAGTVNIRKWVANPFDATEPSVYFAMKSKSQMSALTPSVATASGYDSHFTAGFDSDGNGIFTDNHDWLPWGPGALAYWDAPDNYANGSGNTVMCGDHGINEAVTPQIASIKMFEPMAGATGGDYNLVGGQYVACAAGTGAYNKGFYHRNADLSIITQANGTWKAYNAAGVEITSSLAGVVSIKSMYDARQANGSTAKIKVTQIDVAALASSGKFPANGLLYAAAYGEGTGLDAKGLRLTNGSILPAPLTVVSEDPIYIKGDYNKGDATHPKKGAAVIGDAVNLLSNAWDDSKTKGNLPAASNTTYNTAMISGNQASNVGQYNGGLENLPRFHENWSGKDCTITGSFVNTWQSQYATGGWVYGGDRYTAPNRIWSYDTAFNNVANLPPFTPMAVSAEDIVSW